MIHVIHDTSDLFTITEKPRYSVGRRRIWWYDGDTVPSGCDWQCRVSVDIENGSLTVEAGPRVYDCGGPADGTWADDGPEVSHSCSGYRPEHLIGFARYVQGVVGDELIVAAVEHMIRCQHAQRERERLR